MNKNNYTKTQEKEFVEYLKNLVEKNPRSYFNILRNKKHKEILEFINFKTPKLQDFNYSLSTKVYWVLNNISDFPKCPTCNKTYGVKQNISLNLGYFNFCSVTCLNKSNSHKEKCKKTYIERYSVDNPAKINNKEVLSAPTSYTKFEEEKLTNELKILVSKFKRINQVITRPENKHLLDFVIFKTPKLSDSVYNNVTKIYWVLNNLTDFPKCANPYCDNLIGVNQNVKLSKNHSYVSCCSKKCAARNPDRKEKIKQTTIEKYGVEHTSQSKEIREKTKQTNLEKFGVEYASQSEEVKNRVRQTNLERYGVEIANQFNSTDEILQKFEENSIEKYGTDHPWKNEDVLETRRNTWIEKYGVDNPTKNPEIVKRIEDTVLSKYGVVNVFALEEIKDKIKETNLDRRGVENPFQCEDVKEKIKNTCLEKYGVESHAQSEVVKKKIRHTNLEKYGVEYYWQSTECAKNRRTIHEFNDLFFDSKSELEFYKKCLELNFDIIQSNKSFEFFFKNKKHYYHPDFEVNGFLVEIKGDHFFRLSESNEEEMFCPFRNKNMSDEEYEELCEVYNAKYECMLANDVLIIKSSELENFDYSIFNKRI